MSKQKISLDNIIAGNVGGENVVKERLQFFAGTYLPIGDLSAFNAFAGYNGNVDADRGRMFIFNAFSYKAKYDTLFARLHALSTDYPQLKDKIEAILSSVE